MAFVQRAPELGNQYDDDALLREYSERRFGSELKGVEPELRELGARSGGDLFRFQLADLKNEPKLTSWDAWGNRIDHIELSPLWAEARKVTAEHGLVATAYEKKLGALSRVQMFVKNYVVQASLDIFSCPLAMTDGAARTLLDHKAHALAERALPRLTSRDPAKMWTSGQWMTESTGGSDVGLSETVAKKSGDTWRLYGNKWFTSATTSEMSLTLARPEGNGPGGKGLAMFYLETRDPKGALNGITIHRLKDKLGTRKVPTAEISLDGTVAIPVVGLDNGVRNITPMLTITRTWNAIAAAWGMRRAMALIKDYAKKRSQFGALIGEKPLHLDTLAGMQAETEAGFHLAFRAVELLGKVENNEATDSEKLLLRIITPLAKLTTGKQAPAVISESLECIGGSGYVEDTGFPLLMRDGQVLPIWEGTTNVLSLDTLRAMSKDRTFDALSEEIGSKVAAATDPKLAEPAKAAKAALAHATAWISEAMADPARVEAGARRFALTLGRTLELALMLDHAQWARARPTGERAIAAARRFARNGVDLIGVEDLAEARVLGS